MTNMKGFNFLCILLCFVINHDMCNSISIPKHVDKSKVTQIKIDLNYEKTTTHRLLEMGIHPSVIGQMISKKKPPRPKPDVHNDTIPIFKYKESEFYGEILLGHPGQKFKVVFDTAWSESFVPSKGCPFMNIGCRSHALYDHSRSSLYKANGTKFEVAYGTANITGYLSEDLLHLGKLNVTNQTFAEITSLPSSFFFRKTDGLFGMSFRKLSHYNTTPFFYNIMDQYINMPHIFSFYMNKNPASEKGGSLIFGAIDKHHCQGNITYLPLVDPYQLYWMVHMDGAYFENPREDFCARGCNAVFDSGSTLIGLPKEQLEKIHTRIGAYKVMFFDRYQVDCSTVATLPKITFVFNGVEFVIKGKNYVQHVNYGPLSYCLTGFEDSGSNDWLLGGTFMYYYYTIFDFDKKRVGIVPTSN